MAQFSVHQFVIDGNTRKWISLGMIICHDCDDPNFFRWKERERELSRVTEISVWA